MKLIDTREVARASVGLGIAMSLSSLILWKSSWLVSSIPSIYSSHGVGVLVGGSSGMAVASAIKYALANDLDENQIVVVLAPDSGRSYLEKIFDDDWMRANGYGDVVDRTTKPSLAEQYL